MATIIPTLRWPKSNEELSRLFKVTPLGSDKITGSNPSFHPVLWLQSYTEKEVVFAMPSNAVLCGTCELNLDNSTYSKHRTLLLRSPNTSCIIKFAKFLNSFQQEMLTMSHRAVLSSGASNPAKCQQLWCPHKLRSEVTWLGLGLPSCHKIKIKK